MFFQWRIRASGTHDGIEHVTKYSELWEGWVGTGQEKYRAADVQI